MHSFSLEKIHAAHLANFLSIFATSNRGKLRGGKEYVDARRGAIKLREGIEDLAKAETALLEKVEEVRKGYTDLMKDIEQRITETEDEDEKKTLEEEKAKLVEEANEKLESSTKDEQEAFNKLMKAKSTFEFSLDVFKATKRLFDEYGSEVVEYTNPRGQKTTTQLYDDTMLAVADALDAAEKIT